MTDDVVDGTAVEVPAESAPAAVTVADTPKADPPPSRALVRSGDTLPVAGTAALARYSDSDFEQRLEDLRIARVRARRIQEALMDEGRDYGTIPGTDKPTLYKSGAEVLADTYQLRADVRTTLTKGDGVTGPPLMYEAEVFLRVGDFDGPIIAVGKGSANSWEKRYRYRQAELVCPVCNVVGSLRRTRRNNWWCIPDKAGCDSNFALDDEAITSQYGNSRDNPDPYDLANTLLKMSVKRAFVDGILRATATSGIFTQDLDEDDEDVEGKAARGQRRQERRERRETQRQRGGAPKADNGSPAGPGDACPEHDRKWQKGRYGWYCSAKKQGTKNGYCDGAPTDEWVAAHESGGAAGGDEPPPPNRP